MSSAGLKKDWALISDDEDEGHHEGHHHKDAPQSAIVNKANAGEDYSANKQEEKAQERKVFQAVPLSEEEKKALIDEIQQCQTKRVYLNICNVAEGTEEEDIEAFYDPIVIYSIRYDPDRKEFDIEMSSRSSAIQLIERGVGEFNGKKFSLKTNDKVTQIKESTSPTFQDEPSGDNRNKGYKDQNRSYNKEKYDPNRRGNQEGGYNKRDDRGEYKPRNYGGSDNRNQGYEDRKYNSDKRREDKWDKGREVPDKGDYKGYKKDNNYGRRDEEYKPGGNAGRGEYQPKGHRGYNDYDDGRGKKHTGYEEVDEARPRGHRGYNDYVDEKEKGEKKEEQVEMKGRGFKTYGEDKTMESDKLHISSRQDSYKSQGSGKGGYTNDNRRKDFYNQGSDRGAPSQGTQGYNKYRGLDKFEDSGYNKGPRQGERKPYEDDYRKEKGYEKKTTDVYVKKNVSEGNPGHVKRDSAELKLKANTKNTVNPYDLLEDQN